MRELITFECAGEALAATLDASAHEGAAATGLLIVSDSDEIRIGAHRGMAQLAQRIVAAGVPVFRYDRRGIGDSTGDDPGFEASGPDIAAAADAFREATGVIRLMAFGIGDAATALVLFHRSAGIDAMVLANPWLAHPAEEDDADDTSSTDVETPYADRNKPSGLWRRATGGVSIGKALRGLKPTRAARSHELADRFAAALSKTKASVTILAARGDPTAIAFRAALPDIAVVERETDSHSFARPGDGDWLFDQVQRQFAQGPGFLRAGRPTRLDR